MNQQGDDDCEGYEEEDPRRRLQYAGELSHGSCSRTENKDKVLSQFNAVGQGAYLFKGGCCQTECRQREDDNKGL